MVRQTKHPSENDKLRASEQQLKAAKKKRAAKGWKPGEVGCSKSSSQTTQLL